MSQNFKKLCRELMQNPELKISIAQLHEVIQRNVGLKTFKARARLVREIVDREVLKWDEEKTAFYINKNRIRFFVYIKPPKKESD